MGDIRGLGLAKREQLGVKQRKLSVRAAATGNLTGFTATTKSITNSTHTDGITLIRGDRFFAPHQTTGALNGVYVVTDIVGTTVYLDRADDWRDPGDVTCGTEVYVEEGTVNKGRLFRVSTINPIVIGTTAIVFALVGTGGMSVVGGAGGITAKRLVYVSGYNATLQAPLVLHADATSATAGARKAFFYAPSAIAAGAQGLVFSEYYEAATGVGGGAAGDPVYLSTTGQSTLTAPTAGGADRVSQIVGRIGSGGAGTCWYHLAGSPWDVIGTANLADSCVTSAKIANSTVTGDKRGIEYKVYPTAGAPDSLTANAGTAVATTFASKYTVAANRLRVGSLIKVIAWGHTTATAFPNAYINVQFKPSGAAVDVPAAATTNAIKNNGSWRIEAMVLFSAVGAGGTFNANVRYSFTGNVTDVDNWAGAVDSAIATNASFDVQLYCSIAAPGGADTAVAFLDGMTIEVIG